MQNNQERNETRQRCMIGSPPSLHSLKKLRWPADAREEEEELESSNGGQSKKESCVGIGQQEARGSIHSRVSAPTKEGCWGEENVGAHVPDLFRKPTRKKQEPKGKESKAAASVQPLLMSRARAAPGQAMSTSTPHSWPWPHHHHPSRFPSS